MKRRASKTATKEALLIASASSHIDSEWYNHLPSPQISFYILSAFSNCFCWLLALENWDHRLFCYYKERFATEICRVRRVELRRLKVAETEQGRAWIWKPATRARHSGILVLRCTPALKWLQAPSCGPGYPVSQARKVTNALSLKS